MSIPADFAKIVRASDGRQVLYYVEDDAEEESTALHQNVRLEGCIADMKLSFDVEESAYREMNNMTEHNADALLRLMGKMMGAAEVEK